jgi:hypothetical protein
MSLLQSPSMLKLLSQLRLLFPLASRHLTEEGTCLQNRHALLAFRRLSKSSGAARDTASRGTPKQSSSGASSPQGSILATLFPVQPSAQRSPRATAATTAAGLQQPTQGSLRKQQTQFKHANAQPDAAASDAFVMGREGQQIAAWLFKASILLISIPFFCECRRIYTS